MSKKPRLMKLVEPVRVFDVANRYRIAAKQLADDRDLDDALIVINPMMMLSAFSSELFLKCITLIDGRAPLATHDLLDLFDGIHSDHQTALVETWATIVLPVRSEYWDRDEEVYGIKIPRDLRLAIEMCRGAFESLRYIHENQTARWLLSDLAPHLHWFILNHLRPEWQELTFNIRDGIDHSMVEGLVSRWQEI